MTATIEDKKISTSSEPPNPEQAIRDYVKSQVEEDDDIIIDIKHLYDKDYRVNCYERYYEPPSVFSRVRMTHSFRLVLELTPKGKKWRVKDVSIGKKK